MAGGATTITFLRFAGERAVGLGVTELADEDKTLVRMIDCGRRLRDEDGADGLIMQTKGSDPIN